MQHLEAIVSSIKKYVSVKVFHVLIVGLKLKPFGILMVLAAINQ
jgi:hypothetical protein